MVSAHLTPFSNLVYLSQIGTSSPSNSKGWTLVSVNLSKNNHQLECLKLWTCQTPRSWRSICRSGKFQHFESSLACWHSSLVKKLLGRKIVYKVLFHITWFSTYFPAKGLAIATGRWTGIYLPCKTQVHLHAPALACFAVGTSQKDSFWNTASEILSMNIY